jgi:hypothetical protein
MMFISIYVMRFVNVTLLFLVWIKKCLIIQVFNDIEKVVKYFLDKIILFICKTGTMIYQKLLLAMSLNG